MNTRRLILAAPLIAILGACDASTPSGPGPVRLTARPDTLEAVGDIAQLVATVTGSDRLPEWESLASGIVTVTRAGMVTAKAPGIATVRARVDGVTAETTITVLPSADVRIVSAELTTDPSGASSLRLHIANEGGRGYYRVAMFRSGAVEGEPPRPVLQDITDREAPVGMDLLGATVHPAVVDVEWVVVYSRDPASTELRTTACVRLDGGSPCP